ncbi:MAG: replication initiation protein [Ruminococcus sp.]|nr:replication initiation protein [Ruminococcus sp.]
MSLKNTYIIEKSNTLNEIRSTKMSLQELRFFSIYLAKINARDVSTRRVHFPLSDFQKIMGIGRMNIKHFKTAVNGLLCKVVHMPTDKGGLSSFQIFKEVELFKDDSDSWVVEIDAHDKALPLLFNLKKNYFTYELWNALRLKSVNQLRMYELLKQHERLGKLEITVSELREYLFISSDQYSALKDFRIYVINSCQKALSENTDICFTYEKGKSGNRGKWLTIVFHISKNKEYIDPLELHEFIDKQPQPKSESMPDAPSQPLPQGRSERQPYLSEEFEKDLSPDEINILCEILADKVSLSPEHDSECLRKRLKALYSEMLLKSKEPIKKPVSYLLRMINNTDTEELKKLSSKPETSKKSDDDFCIEKYKLLERYDALDIHDQFSTGSPRDVAYRERLLSEIAELKAIIKEKTGINL